MQFLIKLGVVLFLFITITVSQALGIAMSGIASLSMLAIASLFNLQKAIKTNLFHLFKIEIIIILMALTIISVKYFQGDYNGIRQSVFFIIFPMLLSTLFKVQKKYRFFLQKVLLFFFIVECVLAIYEKIYTVNLFPYTTDLSENLEFQDNNNFEFRSSSLLGHPLMNALVVSIILGFIIISSIKAKYQFLLIILGFIALLSFNSRSAIIVGVLLVLVFIFKIAREKKSKYIFLFFITTLFLFAFYFFGGYLLSYGFGGRLLNNKLLDGSALTRIDVLNALSFISNEDFLLGNSSNYVPVMKKLGAAGVENSFIVLILNYGIVLSIALFIGYYFWIKDQLSVLKRNDKLIIIISFLFLGVTNNGLAAYTPWIFFILCIFTFKPNIPNTGNRLNNRIPVI
ncbi:MAG: hypothetical protein H7141_14820 [Burkholderiales bacterium]|nr:hypothetical protein [Bacteroidia bacterium]